MDFSSTCLLYSPMSKIYSEKKTWYNASISTFLKSTYRIWAQWTWKENLSINNIIFQFSLSYSTIARTSYNRQRANEEKNQPSKTHIISNSTGWLFYFYSSIFFCVCYNIVFSYWKQFVSTPQPPLPLILMYSKLILFSIRLPFHGWISSWVNGIVFDANFAIYMHHPQKIVSIEKITSEKYNNSVKKQRSCEIGYKTAERKKKTTQKKNVACDVNPKS